MLVYPQFARVPPADFAAYERHHQRLVSVAVGPLFAGLVVAAAALVVWPPDGLPRWAAVGAALPVPAVLGLTTVGAVPQHARLSEGFDAGVHRRLLMIDTGRLVAAVVATLAALTVLVGVS